MSTQPPDALAPHFNWQERYEERNTPWDLGGAHPGLSDWLDSEAARTLQPGKALVPGCGSGHDALVLALAGFTVDAVDITDLAGETLSGEFLRRDGRFLVANVLDLDRSFTTGTARGPYDFCYEHTIFCAIHHDQRASFGEAMSRCIRPGGLFLSLLFPTDRPADSGGPPFRATPTELTEALGDAFELLTDEAWTPTSGGRPWGERRMLFRRR